MVRALAAMVNADGDDLPQYMPEQPLSMLIRPLLRPHLQGFR